MVPIASSEPKRSWSTPAPDSKTSLERTIPIASAATSSRAVRGVGRPRPARRPSRSSRSREAAADPERREGGGNPGRPGDDEAGKGRRADAVGEEGQPPQHDLGAEHAGERREQDDLEGGALHEGELERLKHENHYLYRR